MKTPRILKTPRVMALFLTVAAVGALAASADAAPRKKTAPAPAAAPADPAPAAEAAPVAPPAPPSAIAAAYSPFVAPSPAVDIIATLKAAGQFSTLLKALDAAGLTPVLQKPGALTIFAPTDAAFAAVPADQLADLMKPEKRRQAPEGAGLSRGQHQGDVRRGQGPCAPPTWPPSPVRPCTSMG